MSCKSYKSVARIAFITFCILGIAASATGVVAAQEYDIDVDNTVDVRTETVEVDRPGFSGSYEIDEITVQNPEESLTVDVTVPDDADPTEVELQLVNANEQLVADATVGADLQVTFDQATMDLSPGSYSLLLVDTATQTLTPVVISGYDISVTHPAEVNQNNELAIEGTVENTAADTAPESINVVLWNSDTEKRIKASTTDDGAYSANMSVSDLSPGEYNIYVTANGGAEYRGETEIKAIGQGNGVSITESQENGGDGGDENSNDSGDSNSGGSGGSSGSNSGTSTDTGGSDSDDAASESDDDGSDSEDGSSESSDSNDDENAETDSGTIEPSDDESSDTDTPDETSSDDSTPGFGIVIVTIALVVSSLLVRIK